MSNDLGIDRSGNGNNWTVSNIANTDQVVDSPTNNFATLNPLWKDSAVGLAEGNLKFWKTGNMTRPALSTIGLGATGKWYCEFYDIAGGSMYAGVQWSGTDVETYSHASGTYAYVANHSGGYYANGSYTGFSSNITTGQRIRMIAYDASTGKMWIGANGTWSGNPAAGSGELLTVPSGYRDNMHFVGAEENTSSTNGGIANFGQDSSFAGTKTAQGYQDSNDIGDFYYTPPTGFLALCTKNLPDVAVVPSEHFNTVLYSGNNGTQSITGVGFAPDLIWKKARNETRNHYLADRVRGNTKELSSNTTDAEDTSSTYTTFSTDGWSMGATSAFNKSGINYAAWNWKANGSGSSGSSSTGGLAVVNSVNVDAGFSIISWTGNMGVDTFSHGLSKAPEFLIVKNRDNAGTNWIVWHKDLATNHNFSLNLTNPSSANGQYFFGDDSNMTVPDSTYITIGNNNQVNATSKKIICYAWHSVDGYSAVGSYEGNASNATEGLNGTFVYTGFRPAWVMCKLTTLAGESWLIKDSERSPLNPADGYLYADQSAAEATGTIRHMDFLSNGFKFKGHSTELNGDGESYVYIAFAETPFKYSNAR